MSSFNLTEPENLWRISGVEYRDRVGTLELLGYYLDNDVRRKPNEWAGYSAQAMQKNSPHALSCPLFHAGMTALFRNRNGEQQGRIERLRYRIHELVNQRSLLAPSTRVILKPSDLDEVVHDYGTPIQTSARVSLVGLNRILTAEDGPACEALLGTSDVDEVKKVYQWLTNGKVWIFRSDSKSTEIKNEHVVCFGVGSDRFVLNCTGTLFESYSSLGGKFRADKAGAAASIN